MSIEKNEIVSETETNQVCESSEEWMIAPDNQVFDVSQRLFKQNYEAYEVLA